MPGIPPGRPGRGGRGREPLASVGAVALQSSPSSRLWERAGPVALALFVLTVLWAPDAVTGEQVYWVHDLRHHHYPWRIWAARQWAAGRVPLWAPGVANGFPLMADGQAGAFYPPTMLLFLLLPAPDAMNWSLLLHFWWAAFGAWVLMRAFARSHGATSGWGAVLAAVGFGFGGFIATHALYLGMQNCIAWLPWLMAAVIRRRWPWAGICAFMMLVAGHPEAAAFGLILAGIFALRASVSAAFAARGEGVKAAGRALVGGFPWGFAGAMALALVAASPQVLATLELVRFSMRDGGVDPSFANIGSLPPQELVNGILPRFFGFDRPADIQQTYYHRGTGYWGLGTNHWEMAFYLGIPIVVFAVFGARRHRFLVGLAVAAVLLMLGGYAPLWPVVRRLPGLSGFRFPARFALWLVVVVDLLAAAGLDAALVAPPGHLRRWARRLAVAVVVFVAGAGIGRGLLAVGKSGVRAVLTQHFEAKVAAPRVPDDLPPLQRAALPAAEAEDPAKIPAKVDHILASLDRDTAPWSPLVLRPALLALVLAGGLWLRARQSLPAWGYGLGAVVLLYADLHHFGADYQARVPRSLVEQKPAALPWVEGGRGRTTVVDRRQDPSLDVQLISASLGLVWHLRDVILTSPLLIVRNEALLSEVGLDVGDRGPVKVTRLLAHPGLVDMLGVKWLLTVHDIPSDDYRRIDVPGLWGTPVKLYENPDPLVGAWLVGCVTEAEDDPWTALLASDPRHQAVVEQPVRLPRCEGRRPEPPGEAQITAEVPDRIEIAVHADQPALVVQNDTWYPGWRATVDGRPVPIIRTDLIFRGIEVPAGDHEVILTYEPRVLRSALVAMPLVLLGLLGWGIFDWRRRGRAAEGAARAAESD